MDHHPSLVQGQCGSVPKSHTIPNKAVLTPSRTINLQIFSKPPSPTLDSWEAATSVKLSNVPTCMVHIVEISNCLYQGSVEGIKNIQGIPSPPCHFSNWSWRTTKPSWANGFLDWFDAINQLPAFHRFITNYKEFEGSFHSLSEYIHAYIPTLTYVVLIAQKSLQLFWLVLLCVSCVCYSRGSLNPSTEASLLSLHCLIKVDTVAHINQLDFLAEVNYDPSFPHFAFSMEP